MNDWFALEITNTAGTYTFFEGPHEACENALADIQDTPDYAGSKFNITPIK